MDGICINCGYTGGAITKPQSLGPKIERPNNYTNIGEKTSLLNSIDRPICGESLSKPVNNITENIPVLAQIEAKESANGTKITVPTITETKKDSKVTNTPLSETITRLNSTDTQEKIKNNLPPPHSVLRPRIDRANCVDCGKELYVRPSKKLPDGNRCKVCANKHYLPPHVHTRQNIPSVPPKPGRGGTGCGKSNFLIAAYYNENKEGIIEDACVQGELYARRRWGISASTWKNLMVRWDFFDKDGEIVMDTETTKQTENIPVVDLSKVDKNLTDFLQNVAGNISAKLEELGNQISAKIDNATFVQDGVYISEELEIDVIVALLNAYKNQPEETQAKRILRIVKVLEGC